MLIKRCPQPSTLKPMEKLNTSTKKLNNSSECSVTTNRTTGSTYSPSQNLLITSERTQPLDVPRSKSGMDSNLSSFLHRLLLTTPFRRRTTEIPGTDPRRCHCSIECSRRSYETQRPWHSITDVLPWPTRLA